MVQAKIRQKTNAYPVAIQAWFDAQSQKIRIILDNGLEVAFSPAFAQGLEGASEDQLSRIEITPSGLGLHWPDCDADLLVSGILEGFLGSRNFVRAHLSRAGKVHSEAKAHAARLNGARGGRPKKAAVSDFAP
jgi:hypothetical protein